MPAPSAEAGKRASNGRRPVVLGVEEPLFKLDDVARRLRVNPETLRRAIRAGRLRAIVFPGRAGTRISDSALQDYLRSLERGRA
jgi:excisionase family DNA binding protein